MKIKNPTGTVLYSIEQTIKEYRKCSQKNITKIVKDITIDQCLVLIILNNKTTSSQKEIADLIFKDYASVTRMIELMVKKEYLIRTSNQDDRRKFTFELTDKGEKTLDLLTPEIQQNRKKALNGLSTDEINQLDKILHKIISNCKN
jgi:DNA-binding MarR family transcriptional regulator